MRYVASILLSALSLVGLWWADRVFHSASLQSSSTFEFQVGLFALGALVFAMAGAAFGAIFVVDRSGRTGTAGPLFGATVLPALLLGNFFLFISGSNIGLSMADGMWLFTRPTIAVAAFSVGALVLVAVVRTLARGHVAE